MTAPTNYREDRRRQFAALPDAELLAAIVSTKQAARRERPSEANRLYTDDLWAVCLETHRETVFTAALAEVQRRDTEAAQANARNLQECKPMNENRTNTAVIEAPPRELLPQGMTEFMPVVTMEQARQRFQALGEYVRGLMRDGTDYGIIPGTGGKKTLLKPGAEKLCTLFGLRVEKPEIVSVVRNWTGSEHGGEPFFFYEICQSLTRGGELIAAQIGSCNSWETKYRYRQGERRCPKCGKAAIIRGKQEYGGGYICFAKKGGCGAKFPVGDQAIESQQVGRVANPDPADVVNSVLKIAEKRALVAATLIAVNASEYFTQDLEDLPAAEEATPPASASASQEPRESQADHKPTAGPELERHLHQWQNYAVNKGWCQPGELVDHVRLGLITAGVTSVRDNIALWPASAAELAIRLRAEFIDRRDPAKRPPAAAQTPPPAAAPPATAPAPGPAADPERIAASDRLLRKIDSELERTKLSFLQVLDSLRLPRTTRIEALTQAQAQRALGALAEEPDAR